MFGRRDTDLVGDPECDQGAPSELNVHAVSSRNGRERLGARACADDAFPARKRVHGTASDASIFGRVASPDRAEDLLVEISELYAIVLRIARQVHDADEAFTATQRLALIEVVAVGPLRLGQLASRMDTTPATATRTVDALQELGYVRRRPDPEDRRVTVVQATPKGQRWSDRRRTLLLGVLRELPPSAAPPRLIADMARLNDVLRTSTGHDDVGRGALLAR
jgi:DNA-binding MarR family transcriptional regulator